MVQRAPDQARHEAQDASEPPNPEGPQMHMDDWPVVRRHTPSVYYTMTLSCYLVTRTVDWCGLVWGDWGAFVNDTDVDR